MKAPKRIPIPRYLFKSIVATFFVIASNQAIADQFYVTILVQCSTSKSELKISFNGYWNEVGEKAILENDVINPRSLVTFTQDINGKYTVKTKSISKQCAIGKSKYAINVKPLMAPRFHPEGFCATRIGASVIVNETGKLLVNEGVDGCTETGLVATEIRITPENQISIKNTPAEEFYAD